MDTAVWSSVASQMSAHFLAGRGALLTEDSLRLCVVMALQEEAGVTADRMALEVPAPQLAGGKLDLVVDGIGGTVIELKYPRDARGGFSPDTMTWGDLLRDFLRVAVTPARSRWTIQVLNSRLVRYLSEAAGRYGMNWPSAAGGRLALDRESLNALPATTLRAIGDTPWALPVAATCVDVRRVADQLDLYVFRVEAPDAGADVAPLGPTPGAQAEPPVLPMSGAATLTPRRRTARAEILDAVRAITERTGDDVFTIAHVIEEMRRRGTTYAESTVRTMLSSHMCVDVSGPGVATYDDVERMGRGSYRLRPGH